MYQTGSGVFGVFTHVSVMARFRAVHHSKIYSQLCLCGQKVTIDGLEDGKPNVASTGALQSLIVHQQSVLEEFQEGVSNSNIFQFQLIY